MVIGGACTAILRRSMRAHCVSTASPLRLHGSTTALPRLYHGSTPALPRPYHGSTTALPRLYHCSTTALPLLYHGSTTALPLLYHGASRALTRSVIFLIFLSALLRRSLCSHCVYFANRGLHDNKPKKSKSINGMIYRNKHSFNYT